MNIHVLNVLYGFYEARIIIKVMRFIKKAKLFLIHKHVIAFLIHVNETNGA